MQPYLWILISGFAFSWMATLTPLAGKGCGWQTVALARCIVPLVVVTLWVKWDGVKLTLGTPVLWTRSLAGSFSLVSCFYAFTHLPITDVFAISNIFPVWVALLSWPVLGRWPTGAVWLSIACSIAGVFILQGANLSEGNPAAFVVVGASISSAIAMMGLNHLKHLDPRAVVVHFSATALAFTIASYFLFPIETPVEPLAWTHVAELFGIGLTATLGQYYLTRAFTAGDPARVSVASLSQFAMIFVLDIVVLGNMPDPAKLWGLPLVLGPTVWLMSRRIDSVPQVQAPSETANETDLAICADSTAHAESTCSLP